MHTEYVDNEWGSMTIRESLLALLASGPRHGYQLKTEFEARTGGVWPLNIGQVYSTLERLERDGLVVGGDSAADGRRAYSITVEGLSVLRDAMKEPTEVDVPQHDSLMLKVLMAIGTSDVDAVAVIQAERAARLALLQRRRRAQRDAGLNGNVAARLAFDALISRTESELRWLDVCEARLTSPPNGESESCIILTAPQEASVVTVAKSAELN